MPKIVSIEELKAALRVPEVPVASKFKVSGSDYWTGVGRERALNDRTILARIRAKAGFKKRWAQPSKYSR
jgi:hypothetical protein